MNPDIKPQTVISDVDDGSVDSVESQVNISVFLGILILTVFVMPSIGVGEDHMQAYTALVFTALLDRKSVV